MAALAAQDKFKRNRAIFNTDRHLEHSTPIFGLPMIDAANSNIQRNLTHMAQV
jgi:hypothetical protein